MIRKILIIEDEANIADFIKMELEYEGYKAEVANDGKEGLIKALENDYNLIILDLMLPTLNGLEVCRRLKREKNTPVIMLSAKDSIMDKVSGLQIGADDYIAKPFAIEELLARIQVVFRREESTKSSEVRFKDIKIDLNSRIVVKGNESLLLTTKEFELLMMFINNKNIALNRDTILSKVWGYDYDAGTNIVDVYVSYLRNKLNKDDKELYIQTVRGIGYIMRE